MRVTNPGMTIGMTDDDRQLLELVARARAGSRSASGELHRRLWARLTTWGRRWTRDADEAEDVAQVVLMRLHDHADAFEGRSRLTSWLFRITRNVALSRRLRETRRAALLAARAVPDDVSPPDDLEARDEARTLARLVRLHARALSRRQQEVFDLVDLQGLDAAEAARRLGLEPVTVRVLLSRARRAIRLRLLESHPHLLEEYGR